MVNHQKQTTYEDLAPKLAKGSLKTIARLLSLAGKPAYLLLTYIILFFAFILYITGYFTRTIIINLFKYIVSLLYTLSINLPHTFCTSFKKQYRRIIKQRVGIKKRKVSTDPEKIKHYLKIIRLAIFRISNLTSSLTNSFKPYLNSLKFLARKLVALIIPLLLNLRVFVFFFIKVLVSATKLAFKFPIALFKLTDFIFVTTFKIILLPFKAIVNSVKVIKAKIPHLSPATLFLKIRIKLTSFAANLVKLPKPKTIAAILVFVFLFGLITSYTLWNTILKDLPSPHRLTTRDVEVSTKIYDRNGRLLYKIYKDENRTPVTLSDIPIQVRLATLAIEDAEFYDHIGFSIKGIARAALKNIRKGELTGGSTITQQLVKNALLSSEKTLVRKLRELVLALQVELAYSKDEILEMYLNEVSYGGTAYGVQEAARMYYGKDVGYLTLGEAALLAGLPKSPTQFSPFGSNPEAAKSRQKEVLKLMRINGYITEDQKIDAEDENVRFAENIIDIKAPHFVMYVRDELEKKYGKAFVEQGGLDVTTTLDLKIQELAERIVVEEVEKLENLNVTNGAAVVLDPSTGEILAMVGSKNYFDLEADGNVNVTTSLRQPGSSIKVINYAHVLSNGFTPSTIIIDSPTTFIVQGQEPYTPRNYEGGFRGALTLRSTFAESRNVPAVKVLNSYGVKKMIELGRKMGITTWKNPDNYGLSLTLGGGEVKLIDLALVYSTVANYGRRPNITSVSKIINHKGTIIEEKRCDEMKEEPLIASVLASESAKRSVLSSQVSCSGEQVLDPRVAYMLTDILKDNNARSPAFGTNSMLVIPNHTEVAVKTGTSNNLRDNLTVGYNQDYLVAVWVGNNDNTPMARVASGVTGASPIFNNILSALLAEKDNHDWEVPEGLVQLPICPLTGTLACTGCPVKMEWFLEENKPETACRPEWFRKEKGEKEDDKATNQENQPYYEYFLKPSPKIKKDRFPIF